MDQGQSALTQLRAWMAQRDFQTNSKLPAERELVEILGVTRNELRKALAVLEREGELWRHVGKGTFVGTRPVDEVHTIASIAEKANPREVMQARLSVEPQIAREAALNATAGDLEELNRCIDGSKNAQTWRQYENWDNRLHRSVAEASHNTVLLALFDNLNAIRRAVVWGRLRDEVERPPEDHHSFAEHQAILTAIANRDLDGAEQAMYQHLQNVQRKLLDYRQAAE